MAAGTHPSPAYFVVLDTQIWVYETALLRSPLGISLMHLLSTSSGSIGLPEVVRSEVSKHAKKRADATCKKIHDAFQQLRLLSGTGLPLELPSIDARGNYAEQRFVELAPFLTPLPTTLAHFRSALSRVMDETAPNGERNQQYKDSLIWEAVLDFAARAPVHLVTKDNGFFEEPKRGELKPLARALAKEVQRLGRNVTAWNGLAELLEGLEAKSPELDISSIAPAIVAVAEPTFEEYAKKYFLQLGAIESCLDKQRLASFPTGQPNQVSIKFDLIRPASAPASDNRQAVAGNIVVTGSCLSDTVTHAVTAINLEIVQFVDADGRRIEGFGRFLYAS